MSPRTKALLLVALQPALLLGLWAKMRLDRIRCPRCWVRVSSVDPELPIRGRYVQLYPDLPVDGLELPPQPKPWKDEPPESFQRRLPHQQHFLSVQLHLEHGQLRARVVTQPSPYERDFGTSTLTASIAEPMRQVPPAERRVRLSTALPFFIPEHAQDPTARKPGEVLWAEVTVPKKGPLRPIRLAVAKGEKFDVLPLD